MHNGESSLDLSIVIVSYNTRDVTRHCLQTVLAHTQGLAYEVIVVDNGSTDGSVEMIRSEFPLVNLICNYENRGFAAAQNVGLRAANGACLMILNSDVLFVGNTAKQLMEHLLRGSPTLAMVGPQVLNPNGTIAPSARRATLSKPMIALSLINRHFYFKRFLPESHMRKYLRFLARWHDNYAPHDVVRQVEFVDGMCAMVKREVLEKVGLFDEQFFFDAEIIDLANRIRARGWTIEFFPGAKAIHLGHASRKKLSCIVVETHRSELVYYAKHAPDVVPFVRKVARLVVSLRIFLVKIGLAFAPADISRRASLDLYQQILDLCSNFSADSVRLNERTPVLPPIPQ